MNKCWRTSSISIRSFCTRLVVKPMNESQPISEQHASKRLALFFFVIVLLPVLVFLIWYLSHRWSHASAIRQLESKARKNGEPLTCTDLAAMYPPIPDEQNGAALLMDQWEKYDPEFWKLFRSGVRLYRIPITPNIDPLLPYLSLTSESVRRTNDINVAELRAAEIYLQQQKEHFDQL